MECPAYMFNVDFILKNFEIFDDDKDDGDDFQKSVRFRMLPGVCLDVNEDEYKEQVNCGKPVIKNCMMILSDEQIKNDLRGCILAYKNKCSNSSESSQIGCFKIENFQCFFSKGIPTQAIFSLNLAHTALPLCFFSKGTAAMILKAGF